MITQVCFISDSEKLSPLEFPFESLKESVGNNNYQEAIADYAKYYFQKIQENNFEDYLYGPLNPLLFCLFQQDLSLLEELLETYRYPKEIHNYFSPVHFCLKNQYFSGLKVLCDALIKRKYPVHFSRTDFQSLLSCGLKNTHKLIATIPSSPTLRNFPKSMVLKKTSKLFYVRQVKDLFQNLKPTTIPDQSEKQIQPKTMGLFKRLSNKKFSSRDTPSTEVQCWQIPFKYCYNVGTPDSVRLLHAYSTSKTEEFVLSQWKQVIADKWYFQKSAHMLMAFLYWILTGLCTLSVVFYKDSTFLVKGSLGLIAGFVFFEVLQITSYCSFKIKRYFTDIWNFIDWACFLILTIYFLKYHNHNSTLPIEQNLNKILGSLGLLLVYYRSFSHLRVFHAFTFLIGMINTIIQKLVVFFIILLYFFAVTGLLVMNLNPQINYSAHLSQAYLITFFGGIERDDFGEFNYVGIPLIFGSVMVSIVLLNILIAFLSNVFSRLEDQQKTNDLKERASMLLDFEMVVYFFRYVLTGKVAKLNRMSNQAEMFFDHNTNTTSNVKIPKQKEDHQKHNQRSNENIFPSRFLYIFEAVNHDEMIADSVDDNIYKKVKYLSNKVDQLQNQFLEHAQEQAKFKASACKHFEQFEEFRDAMSRFLEEQKQFKLEVNQQNRDLLQYFQQQKYRR
jgi:hypothetical protein